MTYDMYEGLIHLNTFWCMILHIYILPFYIEDDQRSVWHVSEWSAVMAVSPSSVLLNKIPIADCMWRHVVSHYTLVGSLLAERLY